MKACNFYSWFWMIGRLLLVSGLFWACEKEDLQPRERPAKDTVVLVPVEQPQDSVVDVPDDSLPADSLSDLRLLPPDIGGRHIAFPLDSSRQYGYYLYLPGGYEQDGPPYPLIVFLHGSGERGNSLDSAHFLDRVLRNGPPRLIEDQKWDPPFPAVVASPQTHEVEWNPESVHKFIAQLLQDLTINPERIYLTGLSLGGHGSYSYVSTYGDTSLVAAIVPIAAWGNPNTAPAFVNTPVWAFHNANDSLIKVHSNIAMIEAINKAERAEPARITVFPTGGHDSWSKPYSGKGMGEELVTFDAYQETIYEWMFRRRKSQ